MVLKRNKFFQKFARKNKTKELVITIQDRAISSHFPCFLINDESMPLKVEYIAQVRNSRGQKKRENLRHYQVDRFVVFHVDIRKGTKIVKNPALKRLVTELTVYAYREETVQEALQRDGRFHNAVFTEHQLLRLDTRDTVMLSAVVNDLNDVLVKIQSSSQQDSQPSSLEA